MQVWSLLIDFEALALLAVAAVNLTLGVLFACRRRAGAMRRAFGVFAIFVGIWPMAHFFFRALPIAHAAIALRAAYVAAVGIAISLWFFVKYLPDEQKIPHTRKGMLIFPGLLLGAALFVPQFLIQEVFSTSQGRSATLSLWAMRSSAHIFSRCLAARSCACTASVPFLTRRAPLILGFCFGD